MICILLKVTLIQKLLTIQLMYLGVLHSYDKVGIMQATLTVPKAGEMKCDGLIPLDAATGGVSMVDIYDSKARDVMWKPKVSERDTIVYMWKFPRIARQRCGWLTVEIMDPIKNGVGGGGAKDLRPSNKIKLLDVIVF